MKSPLLSEVSKRSRSRAKGIYVIFLFLGFCFMLSLSTSFDFISGETEVGVNLEWNEILFTYWGLASMVKNMRHSMPYAGSQDPRLPMFHCRYEAVQDCMLICLDRQRNPGLDADKRKMPEPDACFRTNDGKRKDCWDPKKMRCWNSLRGGTLVWDGSHDWMLLRHWQGELEMKSDQPTPWMHLRSEVKKIDLFVFSWGIGRPLAKICESFEISGVPQRVRDIPLTHGIVFSGHSEGSGWAACADRFMVQNRLRHERKLIASGSLIVPQDFLDSMDESSKMNSLFLVVGSNLPNFVRDNGVIADIYPVTSTKDAGTTFPQFGYSCSSEPGARDDVICLDPQPKLDIGEGVMKSGQLDGFLSQYILRDMHAFSYYRQCFRACLNYFEKSQTIFKPNVSPYYKPISSQSSSRESSRHGPSSGSNQNSPRIQSAPLFVPPMSSMLRARDVGTSPLVPQTSSFVPPMSAMLHARDVATSPQFFPNSPALQAASVASSPSSRSASIDVDFKQPFGLGSAYLAELSRSQELGRSPNSASFSNSPLSSSPLSQTPHNSLPGSSSQHGRAIRIPVPGQISMSGIASSDSGISRERSRQPNLPKIMSPRPGSNEGPSELGPSDYAALLLSESRSLKDMPKRGSGSSFSGSKGSRSSLASELERMNVGSTSREEDRPLSLTGSRDEERTYSIRESRDEEQTFRLSDEPRNSPSNEPQPFASEDQRKI